MARGLLIMRGNISGRSRHIKDAMEQGKQPAEQVRRVFNAASLMVRGYGLKDFTGKLGLGRMGNVAEAEHSDHALVLVDHR
jgi:hypothetical protein